MFIVNHNLKQYNTFGFEVTARYYAEPSSVEEAKEVVAEAHRLKIPVLVLGGGSNVLFTKDYDGLVIKPAMMGIDVLHQCDQKVSISVGAGVVWDDLVEWCVARNWGGLENLSHIPGSVGAAPVQNIGAYGAEVKDVVKEVHGFYLETIQSFSLSVTECVFGYRSSVFKTTLKDKTLITHVVFNLSTTPQPNTRYGQIEQELQNYPDRSIQSVRHAITSIRSQKLPDPQKIGNAGSFFKNPVVAESLALQIKAAFPQIPLYEAHTGSYKLPAAFLIEKAGWKGVRRGNVGVHGDQPLVLVAFEGATGAEVVTLSTQIQESVKERFGVWLEPEVNLL